MNAGTAAAQAAARARCTVPEASFQGSVRAALHGLRPRSGATLEENDRRRQLLALRDIANSYRVMALRVHMEGDFDYSTDEG